MLLIAAGNTPKETEDELSLKCQDRGHVPQPHPGKVEAKKLTRILWVTFWTRGYPNCLPDFVGRFPTRFSARRPFLDPGGPSKLEPAIKAPPEACNKTP
jgi:hypothetical protein